MDFEFEMKPLIPGIDIIDWPGGGDSAYHIQERWFESDETMEFLNYIRTLIKSKIY